MKPACAILCLFVLSCVLGVAGCGKNKEGSPVVVAKDDRTPPTVEPDRAKPEPKSEAKAGERVEPKPANAEHPTERTMFEVETTDVVKEAVEIRGCRVDPKDGHVLFVCSVRFTEAAESLSKDDLAKLDVSKATKEFAEVYGPLIGYGDFRLRLEDKTLVPCRCLPRFSGQPGPKAPARSPLIRQGRRRGLA
jgi:hypothetical protein